MLFSSPRYFVFIALVCILLTMMRTLRSRKFVLCAASSLFYAAWDYRYLGLLALVSIIDYVAAARIHETTSAQVRKRWLVLSIVSNLGILGYFKYVGFFLQNLNGAFALLHIHAIPILHVLLPAGISFYTFKSMSYTIDVYRKEIKPCESYIDYAMFITFFPELIAGPIVRASVFLPQMSRMPGPTRERFRIGLGMFVQGLIKKRVIADQLALIVDPIFEQPGIYSAPSLWMAVLAYAGQIYCDFSGYSDMAVGSARLIGYELPENFHMPYLSPNITVFWRRWHMTLSSWLRDYLYIPLGGNRKGTVRTYFNLAATMLLGGLWHGASWNFVLWGALHGTALALHKLWMDKGPKWNVPKSLGVASTFLFSILCWVPFRADSFGTSLTILRGLFSFEPRVLFLSPYFAACLVAIAIAHAFGAKIARSVELGQVRTVDKVLETLGFAIERSNLSGFSVSFAPRSVVSYFVLTVIALGTLWVAVLESSPFIYFQF